MPKPEPLKPLLEQDFRNFLAGTMPLYQLKRYLIPEKDQLTKEKLARQIADHFYHRLLEGTDPK